MVFRSCGDPVDGFNGFIKGQIEFLIAGNQGKAWELEQRFENGTPVGVSPCETDAVWLFIPASQNDQKPLLFGHQPATCDSAAICTAFPEYCVHDSVFCAANPQLCTDLPENILSIGLWQVKNQPIPNTPTDTVFLYLWNETRVLHIEEITASRMRFQYQSEKGSLIEELYLWQESN